VIPLSEERTSVLYLTNGLPHLTVGGGPLRVRGLESALSRICDLTRLPVLCRDEDRCAHPPVPPMRPVPDEVRRGAPYFGAMCAVSAEEAARVARQVRPDVVVAGGLECFVHARWVQQLTGCATVLDLYNIESDLYPLISAALAGRADAAHFVSDGGAELFAIEREALAGSDRVWSCGPQDRVRLGELHGYPLERVTVVPNTVSLPPLDVVGDEPLEQVLMLGRLDYFPNVQAAEHLLDEVHPRLLAAGSTLPLTVAGAMPAPALRDRAYRPGTRLLADLPDISGLWRGSVLVVPLSLGGGSRLKILEAFAAGCLVVSSAKGIEGIDARDGTHYLAAETADEITAAVLRLQADPALRRRLVAEGYRLVADRYTPDALVAPLAEELRALAPVAAS